MKVLVACEESQVVCSAFRAHGHEAYSCDLQECSGGHPEWHIRTDAVQLLDTNWDLIVAHPPCTYLASSGASRLFDGQHHIKDYARFRAGVSAAAFFMDIFWADCPRIAIENPTPMKCFGLPQYTQIIEPYMFGDPWHKRTCLWLKGLPMLEPTDVVKHRQPFQPQAGSLMPRIIEPYMFGDPWHKRTCLWLKGLPMLEPTDVVNPQGYWVGNNAKGGFRDQQQRSKTFRGVGEAMATQWGGTV